ncbi:MAG: glycosyltransferase family 4 protein [Chitinophagaceae bacterium]|nr:glycosyltransferase family 4 protein [Chitinophagaceae bacterium]
MPKLIRITTAPISLKVLLSGQMKYMQENGFEVVMVSSDGKELGDVKANEGCRHHIIPMTRRMTPFADVRCLWLLYRFFKKEKPAIVHSHTPKAGLLSMLAAKLAGVKIRIHTIAGLRFVTTKGFSRRVLIFMEKLTGKAATHVWPNSFSLEEYIKENKFVRPAKLEVIGWGSSNGIKLSRYSPAAIEEEKLQDTKKLIQYDPSLIYFLSVGRIVHDKGMDELLNAFVRLYSINPAVRLLLVGAFEDEVDPVSDTTRQLINTHPAVIMAGWSDAVEYFMPLSFALVHPSHREGFPNVLLQAGAMGCPVICSRIDGNIDIVKHQQTGLIFEVKNEDELYSQLKYALENPVILHQYATTLRQQIEQYFDQPIVHSLLHKKYMELLAAQGFSA